MHPGILTDTLNHFLDAFTASWGYLQPSINWLIGILLSIEILLLGLWWALSGGGLTCKCHEKASLLRLLDVVGYRFSIYKSRIC